jgi:hypothetical protein
VLEPREVADSPTLSAHRTVSAVQSGLAVLALVGVGAFFFAIVPGRSRVRNI